MRFAPGRLATGLTAILALSSLTAADWPRFRGPGGSGISAETDLPVRWSDGEGLLWKTELPGPGSSSPIVSAGRVFIGHLFWVNDRGMAYCLKADTGKEVFRERLGEGASAYASLVAADGKLYAVTRRSGTYVLEAKPQFQELAHNTIASDESDFNASPAVSEGRLFLRSNRFLYCVGKQK